MATLPRSVLSIAALAALLCLQGASAGVEYGSYAATAVLSVSYSTEVAANGSAAPQLTQSKSEAAAFVNVSKPLNATAAPGQDPAAAAPFTLAAGSAPTVTGAGAWQLLSALLAAAPASGVSHFWRLRCEGSSFTGEFGRHGGGRAGEKRGGERSEGGNMAGAPVADPEGGNFSAPPTGVNFVTVLVVENGAEVERQLEVVAAALVGGADGGAVWLHIDGVATLAPAGTPPAAGEEKPPLVLFSIDLATTATAAPLPVVSSAKAPSAGAGSLNASAAHLFLGTATAALKRGPQAGSDIPPEDLTFSTAVQFALGPLNATSGTLGLLISALGSRPRGSHSAPPQMNSTELAGPYAMSPSSRGPRGPNTADAPTAGSGPQGGGRQRGPQGGAQGGKQGGSQGGSQQGGRDRGSEQGAEAPTLGGPEGDFEGHGRGGPGGAGLVIVNGEANEWNLKLDGTSLSGSLATSDWHNVITIVTSKTPAELPFGPRGSNVSNTLAFRPAPANITAGATLTGTVTEGYVSLEISGSVDESGVLFTVKLGAFLLDPTANCTAPDALPTGGSLPSPQDGGLPRMPRGRKMLAVAEA